MGKVYKNIDIYSFKYGERDDKKLSFVVSFIF